MSKVCLICQAPYEPASPRQKWCKGCTSTARKQERQRYERENADTLLPKRRAYQAARAAADPERKRQDQRDWRAKHREALNAKRRTPEYRAKAAARLREKRKSDPSFVVHVRMASAVHQALRGKKAGRKWESLVGYTLADLMRHLERQFVRGMTWENMGEWHIDHIRPKVGFDQTHPDQLRECWALSNLRPLWAPANQAKAAKREHLL